MKTDDPSPHADNLCTRVMRYAACDSEEQHYPGSSCDEPFPYLTFSANADKGDSISPSAQHICVEGPREFECTYMVKRVPDSEICPLSESQQACMCEDPAATESACAEATGAGDRRPADGGTASFQQSGFASASTADLAQAAAAGGGGGGPGGLLADWGWAFGGLVAVAVLALLAAAAAVAGRRRRQGGAQRGAIRFGVLADDSEEPAAAAAERKEEQKGQGRDDWATTNTQIARCAGAVQGVGHAADGEGCGGCGEGAAAGAGADDQVAVSVGAGGGEEEEEEEEHSLLSPAVAAAAQKAFV